MNYLKFENAIAQEQYCSAKMIKKVWVIENIKIYYYQNGQFDG